MTTERFATTPTSVAKTLKVARVNNLLSAIRLDQSLSAPLSGNHSMSKLGEMAERARLLRAKMVTRADEASRRMGDLDARGAAALDAMDKEIEKDEAAVRDLENELNQMSNRASE